MCMEGVVLIGGRDDEHDGNLLKRRISAMAGKHRRGWERESVLAHLPPYVDTPGIVGHEASREGGRDKYLAPEL